eukprot:CAMPEP_0174315938 /NCGR_PEP_ID=MMETSP0810-20121108/6607_1 /TAXON_ID=73025 ORGANISM="Eutreptiella gymnastica-like, Strain CCMP1594" /NCGR_SAMPLE_ID=MMETSP0810 /ASSEMBLY_ACC=CAM_ASM_000659 /LENGTH=186 /DNA_ID=CAMNT_0015425465 /DNA_START=34 /DNA_END=594 /DNA_ORIENTATION=+
MAPALDFRVAEKPRLLRGFVRLCGAGQPLRDVRDPRNFCLRKECTGPGPAGAGQSCSRRPSLVGSPPPAACAPHPASTGCPALALRPGPDVLHSDVTPHRTNPLPVRLPQCRSAALYCSQQGPKRGIPEPTAPAAAHAVPNLVGPVECARPPRRRDGVRHSTSHSKRPPFSADSFHFHLMTDHKAA